MEFEPVAGPSSDVQSTCYIVGNYTEKDMTGNKRQKKKKNNLEHCMNQKKKINRCVTTPDDNNDFEGINILIIL